MQQYQKALEEIQAARSATQSLVNTEGALLLGSFIFAALPVISLVLFIASMTLWYKKVIKAARIPCPRCGESFGTDSKLVLTTGGDHCQGCGLSIGETKFNTFEGEVYNK